MPGGSTKFNDDWKDQDDGSNNEKIGKWFSKVNEHEVKCNVCNKTVNIGNKGIVAIRRHAAAGTHKKKLAKAKENEDASRETLPIAEPPESWPSTSNDSTVLEKSSSSVNSSFNDQLSLDEQTRVSEAIWGHCQLIIMFPLIQVIMLQKCLVKCFLILVLLLHLNVREQKLTTPLWMILLLMYMKNY